MTWLRLYPVALHDAWSGLPEALRACLDASPSLDAEGRFTVTRARSLLARLVLALAGMPKAGDDVALRLEVRAHEGHQRWERDFAGYRMSTVKTLLPDGRMAERRGPIELLFRITTLREATAEGERVAVVYHPAGVRLCLGPLRVPIPSWCGPRVDARVWCEPGERVMRVEVKMAVPLVGPIVTYGGPLARVDGAWTS